MEEFEKPGQFYLGKSGDAYTLYDSKELTTHAVCVGMTGSGKTGLGIALLEEAALDKIPAIIIDPKGDLSNLLLTFPDLSAEEFRPWVDSSEDPEKVATTWKEGLAKWGESKERIAKLKNAVEMVIYTPASTMGVPISILNSFKAPPEDEERDKIASITSSLLGLIGIQADPIKSREHILISTIIDQAWKKGQSVDIASLIQEVQKPPFAKIGALDIDTFYPPKERMALSISLNNLLASPGFQAWMEGEPLDIQRLLYTVAGKPKLSIISIAHLSDSERMFFVTLLLNEVISWMRKQPGTSALRAILYMDEIFGYFPPTAMPPSKLPMLTLLKTARAFGLGIFLVTQNPVDLDYKGLANCGTWFIGKLQTERDKMRLIEGLKSASNEEVDETLFSKTGSRNFILRTVYQKEAVLFQTRWTLSYLRGPLTLNQIAQLTVKRPVIEKPVVATGLKPNIASSITEYFAHTEKPSVQYAPRVLAKAKLHFVDAKNGIDVWEPITFVLPAERDGKSVDWSQGKNIADVKLDSDAVPNSSFQDIPPGLMQEKTYPALEKALSLALYQ
ncbi:MAG: ATP-binding protein, partial [Verrucomicrobia bacterium]|nr:ATP-binding protein [Verrucomicrobiota bacterium]